MLRYQVWPQPRPHLSRHPIPISPSTLSLRTTCIPKVAPLEALSDCISMLGELSALQKTEFEAPPHLIKAQAKQPKLCLM